MENTRTETARDTDDSALIDNAEPTPGQALSSGGSLAQDVATQDELDSVDEPDTSTRVRKSDSIAYGQEIRPDRPRAPDNGS